MQGTRTRAKSKESIENGTKRCFHPWLYLVRLVIVAAQQCCQRRFLDLRYLILGKCQVEVVAVLVKEPVAVLDAAQSSIINSTASSSKV